MRGVYKKQQPGINRMIYPHIATKCISDEIVSNINTDSYTKTKEETVQIIGDYVNSIGNEKNPAYDHNWVHREQK